MPIKEIGHRHRFSDASFYKWRFKYSGMGVGKAKRLREPYWKTAGSASTGLGAPGRPCP